MLHFTLLLVLTVLSGRVFGLTNEEVIEKYKPIIENDILSHAGDVEAALNGSIAELEKIPPPHWTELGGTRTRYLAQIEDFIRNAENPPRARSCANAAIEVVEQDYQRGTADMQRIITSARAGIIDVYGAVVVRMEALQDLAQSLIELCSEQTSSPEELEECLATSVDVMKADLETIAGEVTDITETARKTLIKDCDNNLTLKNREYNSNCYATFERLKGCVGI